jgi:transcription initiation factor TFIIIB Brf1 subunit/transcription initiation factor TFIIB
MYPKSGVGTAISGNSRLSQIQKWNSMPYDERVIWKVSNDLKSKLMNHFSQKVISDAVGLYKEAYNTMEIRRGRYKTGLICACVYFSAKQNYTNISPKKISNLMDVDISTVNKCISMYSINHQTSKITKSSDYVQIISNEFNFSFKVQKLITNICKVVDELNILDNCIPQNVCTSVVIFTCNEMNAPLDKNKLSDFNEVGLASITKLIKILNTHKQTIFSVVKNNQK